MRTILSKQILAFEVESELINAGKFDSYLLDDNDSFSDQIFEECSSVGFRNKYHIY